MGSPRKSVVEVLGQAPTREIAHAVGGMAVDAVHTTIDWAGHQSVRVFAHTIVTAEIIGDRFLGANAFSWPR